MKTVSVSEFLAAQSARDEAARRVCAHRAEHLGDLDAAKFALAEAERAVAAMRVSVTAWDEYLARLLAEHEAGEEELTGLVAQRRTLGLKASSGDPEAVAAAAELVRRHADLMVQQDRRRLRIEETSEKRRAAAAAESKAAEDAGDLARRRTEAAEIGRELLTVDREIDDALGRMVAALILRRGHARRLSGLGFPANRLLHRVVIDRALRAAGLHQFIDLAHVSPVHAAPLAEQDRIVLPVPPDEPAADAAEATEPAKAKPAKAA